MREKGGDSKAAAKIANNATNVSPQRKTVADQNTTNRMFWGKDADNEGMKKVPEKKAGEKANKYRYGSMRIRNGE